MDSPDLGPIMVMEGEKCPGVWTSWQRPEKSKVGTLRLKNYVKVGGTLGKTLIKKNIFIPIFLLFFSRYLPWIFPDRKGRPDTWKLSTSASILYYF